VGERSSPGGDEKQNTSQAPIGGKKTESQVQFRGRSTPTSHGYLRKRKLTQRTREVDAEAFNVERKNTRHFLIQAFRGVESVQRKKTEGTGNIWVTQQKKKKKNLCQSDRLKTGAVVKVIDHSVGGLLGVQVKNKSTHRVQSPSTGIQEKTREKRRGHRFARKGKKTLWRPSAG